MCIEPWVLSVIWILAGANAAVLSLNYHNSRVLFLVWWILWPFNSLLMIAAVITAARDFGKGKKQ